MAAPYVNDHSQADDVFDNLSSNFDRIWSNSPDLPSHLSNNLRHQLFLSYSTKDSAIAGLLNDYLRTKNINTFFAENAITVGIKFSEALRQALVESRFLAVILSDNSINSEWVVIECAAAWALGKLILPLLHDITLEKVPILLRDLHCIDIREYKQIVDTIIS